MNEHEKPHGRDNALGRAIGLFLALELVGVLPGGPVPEGKPRPSLLVKPSRKERVVKAKVVKAKGVKTVGKVVVEMAAERVGGERREGKMVSYTELKWVGELGWCAVSSAAKRGGRMREFGVWSSSDAMMAILP